MIWGNWLYIFWGIRKKKKDIRKTKGKANKKIEKKKNSKRKIKGKENEKQNKGVHLRSEGATQPQLNLRGPGASAALVNKIEQMMFFCH